MRRENDGRVTVLGVRRDPPGLARNRRARERWVAMTGEVRQERKPFRYREDDGRYVVWDDPDAP
jgi:hypothetical protein